MGWRRAGDQFAKHFAEEISFLHHKWDFLLTVSDMVLVASACPVLIGSFQLGQSEDAGRFHGSLKASVCRFDYWPSWLVNLSGKGDRASGYESWLILS